MNKIILAAALAVFQFLFGCRGDGVEFVISNSSSVDRVQETVEVDLGSILAKAGDITEENLVVKDRKGVQQPVQTVSGKVIWQAAVPAGKKTVYRVCAGVREDFETKAYSRYVPERKDDYAWENDLVAGRIYGPALGSPRTLGQDIWLKKTSHLVIDGWFKRGDYHHDHGEGMDCYKVAETLGGGALAPLEGGKIVVGDNWRTQKHICDGPVRTEAVFGYGPFEVAGTEVEVSRTISLDAGSRFVRNDFIYFAQCDSIDVILGAVNHGASHVERGEGYLTFTEPASDSKNPKRDGDISIALVLQDGIPYEFVSLDGHEGLAARISMGKPVTVWTASGWSHGGIDSPEQWNEFVRDAAFSLRHPLDIVMK